MQSLLYRYGNHATRASPPGRHRPRRRTAEAAADADVLRIRRPGELAAVLAAAVVPERPDELVRRRHVDREGRRGARARRLDGQLRVPRVVIRGLDGDGVARPRV